MSFPPPPNPRFQPPPPGPVGGGGFHAPPPPPGAGQFQQHHAPPPGQQQQQQQQQHGAFPGAPPPPGAPGAAMHQMNSAMGSMSLQARAPSAPQMPGAMPGAPPAGPTMFSPPRPGPPPPGAGVAAPMMMMQQQPQAPMMQQPPGGRPAPAMFQPPPPGPGGLQQQQQQHPPGPPRPAAGGPAVFQPAPPGPPGMMPPGGGAAAPVAHSNFYQAQPPNQEPMAGGPGGAVPGAGAAGAIPQAGPLVNENIDFNIKIPDRLFQLSASKLPLTATQAASCKIPFGAILRPLAPNDSSNSDNADGGGDDGIATVQPGTAGIIRCKRCRTYINAFVTWSEHGRRWRCNICAQVNDCPSAYFCHLDEAGLRRDRFDRPELSQGVCEFIAPAEYMVRPPQEPTYFFVIDVSATAVLSGMLHSVSAAIKNSLDDLPGRGRTKVGFITFDNCVHYYNLDSGLTSPQMLVVSDLKELFVPLPENLLVNLKESRAVVDAFLNSLPDMFAKHPVQGQSCLGPALKAAFTVIKAIGGKMCVFQSIQPNLGDGSLKPREQPGIMGTPKEITMLKAENGFSWYKDTAIEFSRVQISVDLFLFPYQYMDLAALGELAKFTAGSMHSYVMFNRERDGERFEQQLHKTLTQKTAFEAVMRIRCTKGMRITNFYGNFFIRGTDLMALPNCNTESVFAFDLAHDEQNLTSNYVTIQAALLYTSSDGERRIRVMTQVLPVTSLTSEVMNSVNTDACTALLAKQAIEVALKSGLDNARLRLQQVCVEIIRAAKSGDKRTVSGYSVPPSGQHGVSGADSEQKPIPENLRLLPLYTLALMKNVAFRGGTDIHPDERVQAFHLLNAMWVPEAKHYIYPRMFAIHEMGPNAGYASEDTPGDDEDEGLVAGRSRIVLPPVVNLSIDRLTSDGVYLLDNGVDMYLWVGRSADMNLVGSLFGVHSLDDMDPNQIKVQMSGDPTASRFGNVVAALTDGEDPNFSISRKINVIREGDHGAEARFYWFLVEDRASFQGGTHSYAEFMKFVNNPSASAGAGPPGQGPPGAPRGPPGQGGMPPGPPGAPRGPAGHGPPPPPPNMGMGGGGPPPPPGQMHGGMAPPPPANMGGGRMPPPPGPPAPPHSAPPAMNQNHPPQNYGAPPPPMPPGSYGSQPQQHQQYGAPPPPPQQQQPQQHQQYAAPPPPGGGYGAPPPPGPPGGMRGPPPPGPPPPGPPRGMPPPPPRR